MSHFEANMHDALRDIRIKGRKPTKIQMSERMQKEIVKDVLNIKDKHQGLTTAFGLPVENGERLIIFYE